MRGFEPFRLPSATRLSGLTPLPAATLSAFMGLARLSLLAACLFTLPSCLVDDPPPYSQSKQTPPRLDYHNALPLLDQVIFAQTGQALTFKVPVASEDAGEDLIALLFFDYNGGTSRPNRIDSQTIGASTLDDTSRFVQLNWTVSLASPGCHRLTLRVTHTSNIDLNNYPEVIRTSDLAEAYWWTSVDSDQAVGNTLGDCPLASRGTP